MPSTSRTLIPSSVFVSSICLVSISTTACVPCAFSILRIAVTLSLNAVAKASYSGCFKFKDFINSFDFDSYEDCYVKVIVQNKNNPYWFDIVMDKLYNANPANVNIVDDHRNIDQQSEEEIISEAEDTLTSLHRYVESMDTKVNKDELNKLFTSLYLEAQNMETA